MNPSAMKGSELKGRVRGLCWGLSECLTQTLDGNEGLRPRERAGRAARKAAGDRQLGFSQVLRWAFFFLDVTPILFFFFFKHRTILYIFSKRTGVGFMAGTSETGSL